MKEQFAPFHVRAVGEYPLQGVHVGQDLQGRSRSGDIVQQGRDFEVVFGRPELQGPDARGILFEPGPVVGFWERLKALSSKNELAAR